MSGIEWGRCVLGSILACAALLVVMPTAATGARLVGLGKAASIDGLQSIFDIDESTGALSGERSTGESQLVGLGALPNGTLYSISTFAGSPGNALFSIDLQTGLTQHVGPTGLSNVFEGGLSFDATSGLLYGVQNVPTGPGMLELFSIDVLTGQATVVGSINATADLSGLAFDSAGRLFALDTHLGRLLELDPLTAAIIDTTVLSVSLGPSAGMAFDPSSGALYVADGSRDDPLLFDLSLLDIDTGQLTTVGPTRVNGLAGLAFVPEPTTGVLVALGLTLLGVRSKSIR